jgi:Domain of unknown function (DUF4062)
MNLADLPESSQSGSLAFNTMAIDEPPPAGSEVENRRYQVFVSSTYVDLAEERSAVFDALSKIECIPAGMEIFPAFDEEQLKYIKRVIDDSDYYVLIVGGRYGTVAKDGISFTEKEYDYAVSREIPVLSFIHGNYDAIATGKTDKDHGKHISLRSFITKVQSGRLVQAWSNASELSLKVTQSLTHAMKLKPGIGWVRGNIPASVEILSEINELRKLYQAQAQEIAELNRQTKGRIHHLAPLGQTITLRFLDASFGGTALTASSYEVTWETIAKLILPSFINKSDDRTISSILTDYTGASVGFSNSFLSPEDLDTITVQLIAYGFLSYVNGRLQLSESGMQAVLDLKSVRATKRRENLPKPS